ncbi:MAG: hypothetical protein J5770_06285 [Bacteroidaceae bacterium]|nr:hypothetical protein [Bacteroidaceae bacterium]
MEQSLIEKYLAGETSAQENQLLRQQLQGKSADIRTNEEEALLIMLTGSHQEEDNSEDIFAVDYSCEYDEVVHRNRVRKMTKLVSAITAIAACLAIVWFVGWNNRNDSETTDMAMKKNPSMTQPQPQNATTLEPDDADKDSTTTITKPDIPDTKVDPAEANHYAWAKPLMDSYHEDDLGGLEEDNAFRQDREWAQK